MAPGDEGHVAAQAVELGDDHRAFTLSGVGESGRQLATAIERVGTLTRPNLDMLGDDVAGARL
jgi:hypothetical protein